MDSQSGAPAPPQDDFINWLRFVNAGMLEPGNLAGFEHAIKHMPQETAVVEIGSFCGLSTNTIAHYRRKHGRREPFFTCDKWLFEGADDPATPMGNGGITFGEYRELVRSSFIQNVRAFSRHDLPHTLELLSDEFFEHWRSGTSSTDVFDRPATPGGAIGFCYIDGDHTYAQAKRDFENTDKLLAPGGFILFDDSADGSGWEVCEVVKEALATGRYRTILQNPNYLLQKLTN